MGLFEAIVLGIIQGLTEFLPISSSAHIRISSEFMGIGDPGAAYTAITQLGTETAVLVFFWRDISRIFRTWFLSLFKHADRSSADALMGWWIILGSVPIVVAGLLFEDAIDTTLRSLWFVSFALIIFGVVLGLADHYGSQVRELRQMNWLQALIFGFAQALALIPGVSRSGGTITAGRLMGFTRPEAARYSFLLAVPAVFGSGGYKLLKSFGETQQTPLSFTLISTVVAFGVALVVIGVFMKYISRGSFMPFVVYRIALGLVIITLLVTGVLEPGGAEQHTT